MKRSTTTTPVKGGTVTRDSASGRFIEVRSTAGVSKANPKTRSAVEEASSKRGAALKRLADR
jgi:hypothetical protein